jgi:hypothetical protein
MDNVSTGTGKPGSLQAVAILTLISGILNCLGGLGLLGAIIFTFGLTLLPGAYLLVLGILEVTYAAKLLPESPSAVKPAKHIAVMEIVAIACGQVLALVAGIIALSSYGQAETKAWFEARKPV